MVNNRYDLGLTVSKAVQTDIATVVPKNATVIRDIENKYNVDRKPDISSGLSTGARSGAVSDGFGPSRSSSINSAS